MDWFSLLLVILFVVLPIIQQVLEQARRGGPEAEPMDVEPETLPEIPAEPANSAPPAEKPRPAEARREERSWSDGWAPWPETPSPARPPDREPPVPARATEEAGSKVISLESPRPRTEAGRPLPSPERIAAEAAIAARLREPTRPTVAPVASRRERRQYRPAARVGLHDTSELRRAIILSEVLGPPVSLRDPSDELR